MADDSAPPRAPLTREQLVAELEKIEPPPMQVVHKGWWRTTVTEHSVAELEELDRQEREKEQAKRRVRAA